jgi:hypothetical protein
MPIKSIKDFDGFRYRHVRSENIEGLISYMGKRCCSLISSWNSKWWISIQGYGWKKRIRLRRGATVFFHRCPGFFYKEYELVENSYIRSRPHTLHQILQFSQRMAIETIFLRWKQTGEGWAREEDNHDDMGVLRPSSCDDCDGGPCRCSEVLRKNARLCFGLFPVVWKVVRELKWRKDVMKMKIKIDPQRKQSNFLREFYTSSTFKVNDIHVITSLLIRC